MNSFYVLLQETITYYDDVYLLKIQILKELSRKQSF